MLFIPAVLEIYLMPDCPFTQAGPNDTART
jgi:hypothetical protein